MRAGLSGKRPSVELAGPARHGKAAIRLHGVKHAKPAPSAIHRNRINNALRVAPTAIATAIATAMTPLTPLGLRKRSA